MSYHIEKIERVKDGKTIKKYIGVIELGRDKNGKRHRTKTKQHSRMRDADIEAKELIKLYSKGDDRDFANLSFAKLCETFMSSTSVANKKISTRENYQKVIKNQLLPKFKRFLVKALNYRLLQDFVDELADEGYKYNTISNIKGVLSSILKFAKENLRCIENNPMEGVVIPEYSRNNKGLTTQQENVYIPPEDMEKIFKRFPEGNPNHIPILLGYKCGCRDGEAYALTWDDIDFEEGTLDVNKQLQYLSKSDKKDILDEKDWRLVPPKYGSYRKINIDQETLGVLKREKERQEKEREEDENYITIFQKDGWVNYDEGTPVDFIIKLPHGDFKNTNTRQHIAMVAHRDLKIPYTYHSLRHTHATILAEEGYNPLEMKTRLGHRNMEITLKYYVHDTDRLRQSSKQLLEEIMQKTARKKAQD